MSKNFHNGMVRNGRNGHSRVVHFPDYMGFSAPSSVRSIKRNMLRRKAREDKMSLRMAWAVITDRFPIDRVVKNIKSKFFTARKRARRLIQKISRRKNW